MPSRSRQDNENKSMKLEEILKSMAPHVSTAIFDAKAIAAVNDSLSDRNGKPCLRCRIRGREVPAKPEEIVRQLWLHQLEHRFKYPPSRISVEYPITFGRDSSKRADIVVFDADRPTVPYLIV